VLLEDQFGRQINYVRLAVTDRCNFRCFYCMPVQGIVYIDKKELLSYEEMERLLHLLGQMGVNKVRITGGEPFVRRGMLDFMQRIKAIEGIEHLHITTNGSLTADIVPELKALVKSMNLSMDTLDKARFEAITRQKAYDRVMDTLHAAIAHKVPLKINMVVMEGQNTEDIVPMAELTKQQPVDVRYIEEMPFNGEGDRHPKLHWDHRRILETLKGAYGMLHKLTDGPNSTSMNYQIEGHQGNVGIIAAHTRLFCGTCNRLRITPQGMLRTCLYGGNDLDLRALLRNGTSDQDIQAAIVAAVKRKAKNGFEAEQRRHANPISESMSTIGG